MNNAQRALLIAAGLFLTIALITLVVNLFGSAQEASKQAQNDFSSMQTELAAAAFDGYDNTTLTGSQVMNAVRKYSGKNSFGIQVITGKQAAKGDEIGAWYINRVNTVINSEDYGSVFTNVANLSKLSDATDESLDTYINPSGQFKGEVIRDKSGAVRGLIFKQK